MDKNSITGLLLMGLLLMGFMYCNNQQAQQAMEQQQKEQTAQAAATAPETTAAPAAIDTAAHYGALAPYVGGEAETLTLKTPQMDVTFSSRGAQVSKVVLNKYDTEVKTVKGADGKSVPAPITLFDSETGGYSFEFMTSTQRINTAELNYRMRQVNDTTVDMTMPLAGGAMMGVRYTLHPDKYLVTMTMLGKGLDQAIPGLRGTVTMNWHQLMQRNEVGRTFEERNSAIYYKFAGESPDDMDANKSETETLTGNIRWVAFKNQFFSSVLIAKNKINSATLTSDVDKGKTDATLKDMEMQATFDYRVGQAEPAEFTFYFGPNLYPLLSSLDEALPGYGDNGQGDTDLELRKLVPLGWGIFGWINRWVVIPVFTFLGKYIASYGIIIIILTLFIKLILFPLTYKSYQSQAKMRVLAPEIKEINEKYPEKEDALKRQQETMKLYSKAGASPFSGCLPMLLQMPVLIAMFAFFPSAIELRGQSFLWAHDLSAPDYIFTLPFSIPILGNHLSLFCLLMTVTNIIYTKINMQSQPTQSTMPGMKWMMYLMPLMFLFFFNDYASGLSLYYFIFLLTTILQTAAFRWFTNEDKLRAEMMANAKKPRKKSGFMARLEAAQKQQEALMREQAKQNARRRR